MSKLRTLYIVSLVVLGVLLVFTVFRPMVSGGEYTQVQREHLLEKEDQWVIELHILNHEGQNRNYIITFAVDENLSTDTIPIPSGRVFRYVAHIYKATLNKGKVSLTIYQEGESTPIEQTTYYLRTNRREVKEK